MTRITHVQYDGNGLWIDIQFSNGETIRYLAVDLFRFHDLLGHKREEKGQDDGANRRPKDSHKT